MATKKQSSKKPNTATATEQAGDGKKTAAAKRPEASATTSGAAGAGRARSDGKEMTTEDLTVRSFRMAHDNQREENGATKKKPPSADELALRAWQKTYENRQQRRGGAR